MPFSPTRFVTILLPLLSCGLIAAGQTSTAGQSDPTATTQPAVLSAQDIIGHAKSAYGECTSYRDRGKLEITRPSTTGSTYTITHPFTTAFVRGDRIRIEVKDPFFEKETHIVQIAPETVSVCAHGKAATIAKTRLDAPVPSALAGLASEVSRPFAFNVPRMLLRDADGASMVEALGETARQPNEPIDGIECYVITGRAGADELMRCWIDTRTYAIRRLRFEHRAGGEAITTQISYESTLNPEVKVDPKELEFNPPAACEVIHDVPAKPLADDPPAKPR
jgi:hypothetical protein